VVNGDGLNIARRIEQHEARAWAACVEAAASEPGNPLGAACECRGGAVLSTLSALNFAAFNRVIALGVASPDDAGELAAVRAFYERRAQTRYAVEVTPASPASLRTALAEQGFVAAREGVAKLWRGVDGIPAARGVVDIREVSTQDRKEWAAVNLDAWQLPQFFDAWFVATIGHDGFRHFGAFEGNQMVATGALFATDDVAWIGFDATRSNFRGRGFQHAMIIGRLEEAAKMGCRLVHVEIAGVTAGMTNQSLDNMVKLGFERIYDKECFAPPAKATARR
jgi:hypothetical protein